MRFMRKRKIFYISNFLNLKYLIHEIVLTFFIGFLVHSLLLIIFDGVRKMGSPFHSPSLKEWSAQCNTKASFDTSPKRRPDLLGPKDDLG